MAVLGPLARSAEDLELALDVVAGPDVGNDVAWRVDLPPPRRAALREYRVAVLPTVEWLPTDPESLAALEALAGRLQAAGARVGRAQPEGLGDVRDYYKLYLSIVGAIEATGLDEEKQHRRAEACRSSGDEFMAAYAQGIEGRASDLILWTGRRERYRASFRAFFRDWDVLLAPADIVNAFPHTDAPVSRRRFEIAGQTVSYGRQSFYPSLANLSGHPATAFPAGFTRDGLPIGLQAIGPDLEDRTPIRFAACLAEAFGGYVPPPGYGAVE